MGGRYWGTPVGWYISAMFRADPAAAAEMVKDYLRFLRSHPRADGLTQAWEWCNVESGRFVNPLYVATVALPYISLKEAGLLDLLRTA